MIIVGYVHTLPETTTRRDEEDNHANLRHSLWHYVTLSDAFAGAAEWLLMFELKWWYSPVLVHLLLRLGCRPAEPGLLL